MIKHLRLITLFTVLFILLNNITANTHWESMVVETDTFKYITPTEAPSSTWINIDFDDSSWQSDIGGFGYGDDDDNTIITAYTSLYLRKSIDIEDVSIVDSLLLDIDYDDAFVAYLNGVEVARSDNMTEDNPGVDPTVSTDHEAVIYSGASPERYGISTSLLVSGTNMLAIQVANVSTSSSDMSARVFLEAKLFGEDTIYYNELPTWFEEPLDFTVSNLPIILIYTNDQEIVDEPKIEANMVIINNEDSVNYFNDTTGQTIEYCGDIGIEIRGNTAQGYDKKSYTVETRNADSTNNNVSLFGMPKENDWVLHGPYADKSMMRNEIAYHIGNAMGRWNPRTQYVEVMIDGEYKGIYLFVEKIKRDNGRVDIAKLKEEDIEGDELTGGYIMSLDRDQDGSWNSPYMGRTGSVDVPISYVDPKYDELVEVQREYIKEYITDFEDALYGDNYKDVDSGYRAYIDVESWVDYMIITELSKDIDGYRVSVYFHKQKDSNGGKLVMSPFWDYNLCFGNANFFGGDDTEGWTCDGIGAGDWYEIPFWWDKLRSDPYYETILKYRWEELREGVLNADSLLEKMEAVYDLLEEPSERNFYQWDVLDTYIWPNPFYGGTYYEQVEYLEDWVLERAVWLDEQMDTIVAVDLAVNQIETFSSVTAGPNPFDDFCVFNIQLNKTQDVSVYIYDIMGRCVAHKASLCLSGYNEIRFDDVGFTYPNNMYIYSVYGSDGLISTGKLLTK